MYADSSSVYLPLLLSALALLICVISFVYLRFYVKRRTALQFIQDQLLSEIREEINGLLNSLDEATERDVSLIEEREKKLKSLLDEIDKRLALYIREWEKRRADDAAYSALTAASEKSAAEKAAVQRTEADKAPAPRAEAFPLPEFKVTGEAPLREPRSVSEQIRELVRAGLPPPLIASRLGISISEVELAAALLERRGG